VDWSQKVQEVQSVSREFVAGARRQFGSPEEGERPPLEAVTSYQKTGETQQAEKSSEM
jgi:hypothetical protein